MVQICSRKKKRRQYIKKMKNSVQIKERLRPYTQALPDILNYQIVTKAIICIWLFLLGRLFQVLLKSSGRVAVTSGDWKFLSRHGREYSY